MGRFLKAALSLTLAYTAIRPVSAKEISFTFDDAPMNSSVYFESEARTDALVKKLEALQIPSVIVFANACKREDSRAVIAQLKKYRDAGHAIGNHTCNHPRLDEVGYEEFAKDAEEGDRLLKPLFSGRKFFRFPYLNEGKDAGARDRMRAWMKTNGYRHGAVSVDDDDYLFSFKMNRAKERGKKIDLSKVEALFVSHLVGAAEFYDALAVKTLGYSPKHVLLLHEMDATVMFLEPLVKELRKRGWKIISAEEAYGDKLYLEQPANTYGNNGIISQIAFEKTGDRAGYGEFERLSAELDRILGL